jgi:SPP1 gp7 family putative phage head morphogenesis protein
MPNAATRQAAIAQMMDDADESLSSPIEDYIDRLMDKWNEFQDRLTADITRIHTEMQVDGKVSFADFQRFQGDAQIQNALTSEFQRLHVSVETDRIDALVKQYKDAYNVSAWVIDESTPPSVDIKYAMPAENQIRQFVTGDWSSMFVTRNAKEFYTLGNEIKTQVTLAMLQGQSVQTLSKKIQEVIGDEDSDYKYRSTRIARTELLRAANLGRTHLYHENNDILDEEIWITRALSSARLCEDCAERSGKTRDEVEEIAEDQEMDVDPPCHPNCGCTWAPKIKSMEDLLGPELSKGISDFGDEDRKWSFEKYQAWAKDNLQPMERGNL